MGVTTKQCAGDVRPRLSLSIFSSQRGRGEFVPGPEALVPPFLSPSPLVCLSRLVCIWVSWCLPPSDLPGSDILLTRPWDGLQDRLPHPRGRLQGTVVPGECWLWRTKQCSHNLTAHDEATRENFIWDWHLCCRVSFVLPRSLRRQWSQLCRMVESFTNRWMRRRKPVYCLANWSGNVGHVLKYY